MQNKEDFTMLMQKALALEYDAEDYSKKLVKIFKDNGINLEMSSEIMDDEIKHQMMVKNIIDQFQK